jgi:putative ABC transport system permease protein
VLSNGLWRERFNSDPDVVGTPMILDGHQALGVPRFATQLFGAFALAAVALTAFGVHALLAFWVASRTREMGVRRALGAQVGDVWRLIFGQAFSLVGLGVAAGLVAAAIGAQLVGSLLYEVNARDPIAFVAAPVVIVAVVAAACVLPALRATRVDPAVALRAE